MYDLLIRNGRAVLEGEVASRDLAIEGERIVRIAPWIYEPARMTLDADGLVVLPGLIDPHVHLGLPMRETVSSDDVATGTAAALFGGVTTIIDFTLQQPGQSLAGSLAARRREFGGRAFADYALHANLTDFPTGFEERLQADLRALAAAGSTSVKVFTSYGGDGSAIEPAALTALLSAADALGMVVLVHAEDDAILRGSRDALVESGRISPADFHPSRPAAAEIRAVERVIEAALAADAGIYFVHVSTSGAIRAVEAGRARSRKPILLETCPQYLVLDEGAYASPDGAQYLVAPPLRSATDRAALRAAVARRAVDVVATDHCPFRRVQRDRPGVSFTDLPYGLPGIETRLPILHTLLAGLAAPAAGSSGPAAESDDAALLELVRLTSANPARIFGLHGKGAIREGADADLVLFDPSLEWVLRPELLHMNTDFCPYAGMRVRGRVAAVALRGRMVLEEDEIRGEPSGRYLARTLG